MGKESKQRIKYLAFGILGMISLITGVSFAVFSTSISGREVQTINTGCLKVEMTDNGQLNLTNAYPVKDTEGLTSDPYVYTITNTCTADAYYEATLNVMDGSNLSNLSKIKVALNGDSYLKPTVENSLDNGTLLEANNDVLRTYVLDEGYLKAGESKTFNLRTWIDYSVTSITGQVENKVIIQSEARNGNTIVYNTNSIGYFSGNRETLLKGVSYKTVATESGIVESKSGNSTSYYFRGNPTNTVAFGTYNSSFNGHQEGDSIRWKILSTNSDGSVNLIAEEAIGQSSYTNAVNLLNSFYNTHLSDEESYIKTDSTFCREKASNGSYLAKIRTENNNPTSGCNGNEVYTKIGLPTVDELMFAGAVLDTQNTNFYLYNGGSFLTGSASSATTVYASNASKSIYEVSGSTELGIRPVITVKKDTTLSGAGTSASPYYVTGKYTDESPSSSDTTNPVIVYARVDEKWSNVNKPIEISAEDDAIAGYIVKTTNTTPSANDNGWEVATSKKYTTISTYDNGTYYVFAKDKAGNISAAEQVVIERVDKVAPTCTIRLNSTPDSSVNKTLTVISQDTNIDLKGYTWDDDNSITTSTRKINQNGVYKAYLKDLAGNQGTCQITVTSVTEFYTIIYKANNGVGQDKEEQVAIGVSHKLLKNTYTRVGYGFIGWDTNSSATSATYQDKEEVTNLTTSGNTITLYAIWDANALTFDGDEITKTFNTSGQTVTITGASNGSGTYTYTEKSETSSGQSTNHISISGTTITIGANTPAGTYTYVVTARDTVTGREKDATFTITVNKKALTVEATCNNKTYDGNTTAACSITNTENANVTINGTCTFDNKNAGTSKTVTCSSLTISGTNSSSYSVPSSTTARANITAKALTIKADNKTRDYGSSTAQTYSYTATGFVTGESASNLTGSISYAVKDGNTPVTVNASLAAGTYTIVPSGFTSANYDITYQNGTLTVEGIDAVCPELTGYSGTYDGQSHTITTSGHSGGTLEYRTSATEGEWTTTKPTRTTAGETTVYVRVKGDSNHKTKVCDSETIEIAKREITVTATTQEKTYDGTALNANNTCSVTTGTLISGHTVTCAASGSQTNAGTSTKTLGTVVINDSNSNAVTSNYQITKANGSLKVNMKSLTITVDDKERNYGSSAVQTYSYTATGFVNGEDESVFTGTATYKVKKNGTQVTVDENLAAGSYVIQLTGLYASNYNIEIENGTLTVNKINATCPSLTSYSGTYDGNAHSITVGNNAVGGTVKYRTTTNGTWSATKPEITNVADSPKTVYVEVEGDTNHNTVNCYVTGTTNATITLAKKTVTVKAENKEMTYGGNAPSYTYTISGVVTGDTAVTGSASYQVTDNGQAVSNVSQADAGTYTITPSGLTANNNYTISYQTGTLTINRSRVATTGSCINNLVYDGEEKTLASGATHASYTNNKGTSAQNENAYTVTVNAATNYAFSDGTTSKTLSCVIHRANGYVTVDNNKSVEFGTTSTTFNVLTDHGGTLSVTDDNGTATSSISGKVVTIGSIGSLTAGTEVEVTVTSAQTANYKSASKVFKLTIGNKKDATTGSCASNLVYNTTSQSLASGGANVTYVNNQGTNASDNYTVTVNANTNHAFSDGSTSKTLTCSIAKATPVLTISPASGTSIVGSNITFTEKSTVAGKFTNTTSDSDKATVSPVTNASAVPANTNSTVTVTPKAVGEATITVTFVPTDTTNYNSITSSSSGKKIYTLTTVNTAAIPTTSYCKSLTYNGDNQTLVNAAGTGFTWDSTTTSGKNATSYTVKANVSNGYRWSDNSTSEKSITCSISKKGITVKAEDKEMIYGGSAPTYTYQVTGVISGETGVTGTASYAVKNSGGTTITVGPNTSVGEYTIHVSGLSATSNYQITATNTGTLTVVEDEAVCPSGSNYAGYSGTYDGNSHTITATGEQGGTLEYRTSTTGNWSSTKPSRTNAGTTTVYVRVKGDSNHSDKDCGSKTIVINPKTLTVTGANKSRAYGESNPTFTYTYSGNISGETPAFTGSLTTSATTSSAVGSYDITKGTLALADGTGFIESNYTMSYQKGTLTVTAATPTVNLSAKTEAQRTYTGSAITANSATVTLKNSETYSGTITYKYYTNSTCTTGETTTAPTNVGTYYAQASIAAAGNYTSAKSSCVNHSIVEAEAVCPSGTNYANYSGTYDGESHTITATGHSGGSLQYRTSTSDEWSSTKPTGTNVADSKTVYVRVKGDSNHNDKDCGSKTITISKKTLTVTAANKSRTYGAANPTFTYTSSGAVSGETPAFTGNLTTSATTTSPAGTYDITQGTLALTNGTGFIANNYTMSYTKGTLTVTEKEITVTATNQEKVYDGSALSANTTCSVTSGSLETGHTVTCSASGSQGPDIGTSTKTLGTVTIKDGSNNDVTSSYDITKANGTLKITARPITITAKDQSIVYGSSISTGTGQVTVSTSPYGLVSGHSLNSISLAASTSNVTTTGKITPSTAVIKDGSNNTVTGNYNITYAQGDLTITQRPVTVTAPTMASGTLTYSGSDQTITGSAGSCSAGGTMYYYTTNYTTTSAPTFSTSTWSTTFPSSAKGNSARTYYLWYYCYVSDTTNNKAASGSSINTALEVTKVINQLKCATPTSVAISTAGYVSWTNSATSACTTHQVKVASGSYSTATSPVDKNSDITGSTGTRTVNVKAVAPNANYLDSDAASASVTVYAITFASNDTNKGTVSPASKNVISGATVATSGNNLLIKGVTTGTTTTTLQTVTPTPKTGYSFSSWSKTSGSLTSAQTITGTFGNATYSITYKDCGDTTFTGTHDSGYPTSYTYGTGATLDTPEKTSYTFGGYYSSSSCTGDAVTSIGTSATGAKTFYAKWKKNITVTATNQEKVYDGSALSANTACSVTTGTLDTGDTVTCTASGSQGPDIGTSTKTLGTVTIKNSSNTDVTGNYQITKANGTLKITARPITITAKDQSIVYGSSIATGTGQVTVSTSPYGLVSGHSLNSISLAASTSNVTTTGKITPSTAVIKDGSNNTVTGNYNITYAQGDLTITQREVTVTAPTMASGTLTYSGSDQTITGSAGSCSAGGTMYYYTTNYTTTSAPTFSTSTWSTTFPSSAKGNSARTYYLWYYCYVSDTTNNKAASGSSINTALSVTKAIGKYTPTLAISATTGSVNYNATNSFTATPTTISSCVGNLTATSASASYVTTSTTSGGTYAVSATHSDAASGTAKTFYYKGTGYTTGNNVTVSYTPSDTNNCNSAQTKTISIAVNKVNATCPTLTSYSGTYDGSAHSITVGSNASGGTVKYRTTTNGTWSATKPSITNVADSPTTVYVEVEGDTNHNTVNCYVSGTTSPTITISKRKVTVTAPTMASGTLTYSGSDQTITGSAGSCSTGGTMYYYTANYTTTTAPTFSSTSSNWSTTFPSSAKGNSARTYYLWYYCYVSDTANNEANSGSSINTALSVTKAIGTKAVTVTATNQEKVYDGSALSADGTCSVTTGTLVSGHSVTCTASGSQGPDIGTSTKTLGTVTIKDGSNNDVTSNYNVTKANGTLKITARPITITAKAQSIVYGSSIATGTGQVTVSTSPYGLVSGHSLNSISLAASTSNVTTTGKITPSAAVIKDGSNNTVTGNYNITYAQGDLTITQRPVTVTAPTMASGTLTYSGSDQTITGSAGSCSAGGTMYYYTTNYTTTSAPTFSTSTWSTTFPSSAKGNSARTYYLWYYCYVSDTTNNKAASGSSINTALSVTKAIGKYTPTLAISATTGSVNYNATNSFTATPTTISSCVGNLTATSASASYVTTSTTSSGTYAVSATHSDAASASAKTFYYKGIAYTTGNNVTVSYTPSDTTNCNSAQTKTISIAVNKVDATCPTLTAYSAQYDGSAHGIGVSGGSGGTVQYRTSTSGNWSNTKPTITNVADSVMTTYVQVSGDSNHNTKDCGSSTVTISKRKVTVTKPTANSSTLTYSGSAQNLLATAGSCSAGGTMYWWSSNPSKTQTSAPTFSTSSGWTTTAPTSTSYKGTEAGTYYMWYYCYVSDTANNEAASGSTINTAQSITKAINKADPTITLYTTSSGTTTFNNGASRGAIPYDSNIKSYPMANIAGSWKAASSNTTYVTVSPTSNTSTSANTRREITATGAGYTTSAITVTLTFTPTDTTNYNTATRTYTHTVSKVDATCPTLTAYSAQYDGSAHGITVGSNASGGTVQYRTSTSGNWSNTKPTITNVADSVMTTYVQVSGDSNHNTKDCGSSTVTISKRKVTVTAPTANSSTLTYSGSAQNLLATAGSCSAGGTMYWWGSNPSKTQTSAPSFSTSSGWTTTAPSSTSYKGTDAGTYYMWYYCYVSDTANNEAASGSTINTAQSITKAINTQKCATPTSVAVSTGGYVTWTNSATSACTTHQVKVASGSYATATSPVDKNSDITGSTGSRTVNVKAVAPNSNYSDSDAASASVTVYAITLASNDTNKGTVSPTSKNVISGTTLATSGNNLLIKGKNASNTDVTLATVTPTAKTGYSFSSWSKTSGSLTSAQTITATFTGNTYTATFYYQSNTTSGSQTVATTTSTCTVTSGSSCTADIPTTVRTSGGKYNNAYAGLNTSYGADMNPDVAKSATTVTLSANSNYYTIYSTGINIYYPSSASATTSKTVYQNQWFTSNTAMATTVISSTATGTTTDATAGTLVTNYSLVGFNTSASQNTANSGTTIAALGESDSGRNATRSVYQVEKKEDSVEATFYYSTASDGTVGSVTASGTRTTYLRPTSTSAAGTSVTEGSISAPTLTGAVVPTATKALSGFATSNSSMTTTTTYTTANTKYYKVYRSTVTVYKPTSTSACDSTNTVFYRNAYINTATPTVGTTKYTKVLSTTNTGLTDNASYTPAVTGYDLAGYVTSAGTGNPTITYATLTGSTTPLRDGSHTTAYAVLSKSVEATFYYSTAADGTVGSTTASGSQYVRCSSTSAATIVNTTISFPTLTGETSPTGTSSVGWATSNTSMSTTSLTTANTTYYKVYRSEIALREPTSTDICTYTSNKYYRSAFINTATPTVGTTKYKKVLSTTNTGTTDDATYTSQVSGYTFAGFATVAGDTTIIYETLTGSTTPLRDGSHTTVNVVLSKPVDVTLYYSNSSVGAKTNSTVSGNQYVRCTSSTAGGITNETITAPFTTAPYGTSRVGWATSSDTMTTATLNTANTSYYAVYSKPNVVINYYGTSSYTAKNVYRNGVYGTNTNYTMYLSDTNTGTSNYATATGPGGSTWTGLSTASDTTPEYTSVGTYNTGAAYSTNTGFYTVYTFNVNYEQGSHISNIGASTGSCKVNATASNAGTTSCTVTLPSITPEDGYVSVGWNTTNGATTGTAAGQSYTITANPTTLYANALPQVTYNAGSCPSASGLPASQTKQPSTNLTLQTGIPTCSNGKAFIGWSTSQSATETSTWYNEGGTYTDDAPLTLYAQWYDVASLENWYTTAVQSGDFSAVTENSYTVTRENSTSWNYTATNTTYPPTQSGYVVKGVSGFSVNGDYYRPFGVDQDSIKVRDMRDASTPVTPSSSIFSKQYMSVKSRTATTYTSDTINARIDRLQKIQDVALTYDDIETRTKVEDNISMTHNKSLSVSLAAANADWQPVALAGHNLANATTNGINTSRTALVKYYKSNAQSTPGNADNATIMLDYYANPSNTPKVKLTIYYIVAKNKTARSTTFNGTTLTTQGASRYAALVDLDSTKGDYFPESYVKRYTRIEGTTASVSAWGTGTATKNISIPDGKILGIFGHGVSTGTNGEGSSYSIINKNYVTGINTTSGTYNMTWYAGNADGPDQNGHAQTQVFGWGHAFYISSGTMTVTDSNQFTVSYSGGDGCANASELPSSQTKINGTNLTLRSDIPTCPDGKIFLGWATSMRATDTEGTWYDPGSTYTANEALTLYAQWADIDSLEEAYTTYVQADDFHQERASNTQTITAGNAKAIDFTVPTVSGYTKKMRSGFSESVIYRPYYFSATNRGIYRNMASGSATAYDYYLYLRDRTETTYSSDSIDTRIDRLLKLQDVVLSYSDIKGVKQTINPVSITTSAVGKGFYPDNGWKFISASGFEINTNDVSGGQNVTNTYVLANYVADDGSSGTLSVAPSISNANAKVSYWANFTEVNNSKTARTTTFAPTSGKGLARYNALEALKADKSNHFPASYFKTTRVNVGRITKSAWGEWNSWKDVSIPNGKVLGIVGFAASNDTSNNGSGESFAAVTDVWPGSSLLNNTSGQLFNTVYAANSQRSVSTGNAMSNVNFYNDVLYVSSGTLTGGTVTWE